jgi:tryptophan-rich hypothetical protein
MKPSKNVVNPNKLLHSKWTAISPVNKEKHFIVTKLIVPEIQTQPIEFIELEAVYSKRKAIISWRKLNDLSIWAQGWRADV